MLGQAGKDVTIVEMRNGIALEDEPLSQIALNTELTAAGVKTMINTTVKEIKVDTCSNCHPFFTGRQRFAQAQGRVEKFNRKYGLK